MRRGGAEVGHDVGRAKVMLHTGRLCFSSAGGEAVIFCWARVADAFPVKGDAWLEAAALLFCGTRTKMAATEAHWGDAGGAAKVGTICYLFQ